MSTMKIDLKTQINTVENVKTLRSFGKVSQVIGLIVEATGLEAAVGEVCRILVAAEDEYIVAEVVGFKNSQTLLMPLGDLRGIAPGCLVEATGRSHSIFIGQ